MKCAHPGCKCNVTTSRFGDYCSDHCRKAGDQAEARCTCGHPGCQSSSGK